MKSTLKSAPGLGRGDMCIGPRRLSSMDGLECLELTLPRLRSRVRRVPSGGEPMLIEPKDLRGGCGEGGVDMARAICNVGVNET
jgi:hypothetical protein